MLSKFFLFSILLYITQSPLIAIAVLLVILYVLERRYIGLTPSLWRPFQLHSKVRKLRDELRANPHAASAKFELARILMQQKKFAEALPLLQQIEPVMEDSADFHMEIGTCHLKLGSLSQGETYMLQAIQLNPRVGYGDPYLRLGEAHAATEPEKAIEWLEQFRQTYSSSCEAYYRLGILYQQLGRTEDAKQAFRETLEIYRTLPKYNKRKQRKWALLARFKA